ncbi:MAG: helix-turn-helix transcriptional regulator [Clostridiales bacterium]|nr:helix-turn-helix domain-containing protein [uncultured Anaerosporobacter sp.]MBS5932801.1 helix-turn-helix transcriptional regulator [Clostridiales bacterium]
MISFNNKEYVCLLDFAMDFIRGKWKALILCNLYKEPKRFLELQRFVEGISQKILNENLKELERDGLITKLVYAEVPPKVEYSLTDKGKEITKLIKELENWSVKYYPELEGSCK